MSSKPSLLLIGTGLIGGDLLFQLIKSGRFDITVGARRPESIKVLQGFGVKTANISLQDHKALTEAVKAHDVIINAADADDVAAAKAMIAGLQGSAHKKTFVQVSGAGVYGSLFNPNQPADFKYNDDKAETVNLIADGAPHREVDLEFWKESQKGASNIIIAIPSTVYGRGGGPFKSISTQVPMKVRPAIKNGYATYGSKAHIFTKIHVEDNSSALMLILNGVLDGTVDVSSNPYFNINDDEPSTWKTVAHRIAEDLHQHGVISTPTVKVEGEWDFYGIYNPGAVRLQQLGWKPRFANEQYLLEGIDHEVRMIVRDEINPSPLKDEAKAPVVLVTGGSGYLGSAIVLTLLRHARDFVVRLALRNRAQFDDWIREYPQFKNRLDYAQVTSLTDASAYTEAVRGVTYIVHTASPDSSIKDDTAKDLLDPAIKGTTNLLEAASKESTIKSIAFTSSIASHVNFADFRSASEKPYDGEDWNSTTYEQATDYGKNPATALMAYAASKALADKAAFDFVASRKPTWALTAVSPCWILGPTEQPHLVSVADLRSTSQTTYQALFKADTVAPCPVPFYVDVRDAAWVHVESLFNLKAAGKRYILSGGRVDFAGAARTIKKAVPALAGRLSSVDQSSENSAEPPFAVSSAAVEEDFGIKFIPFNQSVLDWASQIATLAQ